jgi:hypothetical protein
MDALPQHIGYIIDGNRRWAKQHGLPTYEGHLAGDIVSDPGGSLWVITEEGAEPAEAQADVVVTEPDGDEAPYAILADGRLVLVVDIE